MRIQAVLAAMLFLAGCASGVPVDRTVIVPGGKFTAVQGEADLIVRTVMPENGGELLGATCDVRSSLYQTQLLTPARLVVPNFGPQSPELFINCRAGDLMGKADVGIVTLWQDNGWGYPGVYGGAYAGPWRGPWAGPWAPGWGWPGYPVSRYPDVRVIMQPHG